MDSGFPICQVLGDPLVHTSRYTTFLEFKSEPIFPDPVICLLHVYPHHQSMLFILKAILDLLGNLGHLVFSGTVLLKACLLWSDDVVLLQVPYQASVDHSFHEFAHTTGEADRTVTVCICSILALLVDGYHVRFSPALRNMPCLPAVVEDSQEFGGHLWCPYSSPPPPPPPVPQRLKGEKEEDDNPTVTSELIS